MSSQAVRAETISYPRELSDADLKAFQKLSKQVSGIELDDSKKLMVYSRFSKRIRTLGIPTFSEYLALVQNSGSKEMEFFINTITTNLTYFFREHHHFEFLASDAMPGVMNQRSSPPPARIWSAGCSLGAEPYSIALTLNDAGYTPSTDYRILCTDIDSDMVCHTANGVFSSDEIRGLSQAHQSTWFDKNSSGDLVAKPAIRQAMVCKLLNLFGVWPIRPGVDIIFCRNTLIYFTKPDQDRIVRGFGDVQSSGAYLFLGHSESLRGMGDIYSRVSHTVYQRR
ncbi:MAG: protein-glutamate O-methyltransferase CheR [Lysobacterales bacterium]